MKKHNDTDGCELSQHMMSSKSTTTNKEPPHPSKLLSIAQSPTFCQSNNLNVECNELESLCQKIDENASWCCQQEEKDLASPKNRIIDTLLDATRALIEIHRKGSPRQAGNGIISDPAWSFFNGSNDVWGSETWESVAEAWQSIGPELEPQNMELAQELFDAYQRVQPYGFEALESTVKAPNWPAMMRVREEASNALPKADATRIDISQQVLTNFERGSQDEHAYGIFRDECIPMVQTFVNSNRSGEYMDLAMTHYSELWNRSMLDPSPREAWSVGLFPQFGPEEMARQNKLASIVGVSADDNFEQRKRMSLRFVFLDLEKRFRYAFEDAVDPDHQLELNRHRY